MRAIINGAGIAGLTLAWWLDRLGWDVVLLEIATGLRDEGYMIDFFGSGYDAAEQMGLIDALAEHDYPISDVSYVDDHGHRRSRIDYQVFRRVQEGRLFALMRGDLVHVLHDALGGRVDLRFDVTVESVSNDEHRVGVVLTDGSELEADLLVGADGIHSHVRRLTWGPEERFTRFLGFHTAAYIVSDPELRNRLAGAFGIRSAPGKQAGLFPIRGGRVATFFAHGVDSPALPSDRPAALRALYGDMGWFIPRALEEVPSGAGLYYDVVAQVEMPGWSRNRVTLVGDAGHAVSLLAGQGASMAMGGAYVLADELARSGDVVAALECYERRVKPLIEQKQAAGRRTAKWFVPSSRRRIRVRDAVLRLAGLPVLSGLVTPFLTSPGGSIVHPR